MDAALRERGQQLFVAKLEAQRKGGLLETLPSIPGEAAQAILIATTLLLGDIIVLRSP